MPSIIVNLQTGEKLEDNPENRKLTFRKICESDYKEYKKRYKVIRYGKIWNQSSLKDIEKCGLLKEHEKLLEKAEIEKLQREKNRKSERDHIIRETSKEELAAKLIELYDILEVHSQGYAIEQIENYKEAEEWCDSYR